LGFYGVRSCFTATTNTAITMSVNINVSLEPHLAEVLRPIYPFLPDELARELKEYVQEPLPSLIPYDLLLKISQWSRIEEKTLRENSLDPHSYSMIALQAGTTAQPDRKLGDYVPPKEPEEIEADRLRERKAITSLVNAVLSVGGVGFGAYWAADKTGWKDEWVRSAFLVFKKCKNLIHVAACFVCLVLGCRRCDCGGRPVHYLAVTTGSQAEATICSSQKGGPRRREIRNC